MTQSPQKDLASATETASASQTMAGPRFRWHCRNRILAIGHEPLIMGIVNVTPDSFSDGGQFLDPDKAIDQALQMLDQGASIVDIGGESTRPGAPPVPPEEQIRRVRPVIEAIARQTCATISIDTTSSKVAQHAIEAGANIINDISGFRDDPFMIDLARETKAGVIIMHMQGKPQNMQNNPQYDNCVQQIYTWIQQRSQILQQAGIRANAIAIDPGIGFGKNIAHNLEILQKVAHFNALGFPLLVGASKKRFIGVIGQAESPCERLPGSLAALTCAVMGGASILRVHDVAASLQAARVAAALRNPEQWQE